MVPHWRSSSTPTALPEPDDDEFTRSSEPNLRRAVEEAFAGVKHPGAPERIREDYPCCADHDGVAQWLSSHTWQEWAERLADRDFDPTEFWGVRPEAYQYFLPGLLVYLVESAARSAPHWDDDRAWKPLDWVYNALIPFDHGALGLSWTEELRGRFLSLLTDAQRAAVVDVLRYVATATSTPDPALSRGSPRQVLGDIQLAIEEIWTAKPR